MELRSLLVTATLPLVLCIACNNGAYEAANKASASDQTVAADSTLEAPAYFPQQDLNKQTDPGDQTKAAATVDAGNPDWDRKIVKTADLSIEVKHFRKYEIRLHDIVKKSGGYIAQEAQTQNGSSIEKKPRQPVV